MTIRHHPTEESLARYAAGGLPAGPSLVVATHLASCPDCRERSHELEAVCGALLEGLEPTPLAPDALAKVLARIDGPEAATAQPPTRPSAPVPMLPGGIELPEPLRGYALGRWRWLGPGIRCSRIALPQEPDANLMLLRVGPGRKLPAHGHAGTEFTQVISGTFSDDRSRYVPGDLVEAGPEIDHQPVVDPDGECICLAAVEGRLQLHGFFGRLLQPFARI